MTKGLKQETWTGKRAQYRVSQLGFGDARKVITRAGRILAPAVAKLEGVSAKNLLDLDVSKLGGAFSAIFDRLTDEDQEYFIDLFAGQTQVKVGSGGWVPLVSVMELHFAGREGLAECFGWLRFCAELNFGPFSIGSEAGEGDRPEIPVS